MRKPSGEKTATRAPPRALERREIADFLRKVLELGPGRDLREEDRKKVIELAGLLPEIERALAKSSAPTLVDAASGRGWVSLAAIAFVAPRLSGSLSAIAIERDARRTELTERAASVAGISGLRAVTGDVADPTCWPDRPDLVVALHACGDASDRTIERAIASGARTVLLAPCCVAKDLPAALRGREELERLGLPSRGEIRRRFVESFVVGMRTLALEAGGYHTEGFAFVPETVTPYNVLLRGRFVNEPVRRARAREALERLTSGSPR